MKDLSHCHHEFKPYYEIVLPEIVGTNSQKWSEFDGPMKKITLR